MSWSISVVGTRDECLRAVEATQGNPPDENLAQFNLAKGLVLSELHRSDPNFNGKPKKFTISFYGHANAEVPGDRNFGGTLNWSP